jgi:hypothetical protein
MKKILNNPCRDVDELLEADPGMPALACMLVSPAP